METLIDVLVGTNVSHEAMVASMSSAEARILSKMVSDFSLDDDDVRMIVVSLYRFKKTLSHYHDLSLGNESLFADKYEFQETFKQVRLNLFRDSRSCFAKQNFFSRIRFLLEACEKLCIPRGNKSLYLKWTLDFIVFPAQDLSQLLEHDAWQWILPHRYMYRVSGFVRHELEVRYTHRPAEISPEFQSRVHKEIVKEFNKKWKREIRVRWSERRWFSSRLSGSFGSGKN